MLIRLLFRRIYEAVLHLTLGYVAECEEELAICTLIIALSFAFFHLADNSFSVFTLMVGHKFLSIGRKARQYVVFANLIEYAGAKQRCIRQRLCGKQEMHTVCTTLLGNKRDGGYHISLQLVVFGIIREKSLTFIGD